MKPYYDQGSAPAEILPPPISAVERKNLDHLWAKMDRKRAREHRHIFAGFIVGWIVFVGGVYLMVHGHH